MKPFAALCLILLALAGCAFAPGQYYPVPEDQQLITHDGSNRRG
jgi:hypothetical protein